MPRPSRFTSAAVPKTAEGWALERMTPPSALYGANGIRAGADGRIYIAQATGSQISAVDIVTGDIETISPQGGDIIGPDDLAIGPRGEIYATELNEGRVSVLEPNGRARVVCGDLPAANGITLHRGRLFVDESRHGGRVVELDLNGGEPRVLVEGVPMANACEVGPDGRLYFPVMEANQIWRVDLAGGPPEIVAGDLGVPDSVKFDARGHIISTQVGSGELLRIDPRSGERTVLAAMEPGLDNITFIGDRLFVSHIRGQLFEITAGGEPLALLRGGMVGPLGVAFADDGELYIADGSHLFALTPAGDLRVAGRLFGRGWPGYLRGIAAVGGGEFVVTMSSGGVARWRPAAQESEILARGLDQPHGVAVSPNGAVIVAELGGGRVLSLEGAELTTLASGLAEPRGVAIAGDGTCLVSESGAGRVVQIVAGRGETVLDGLVEPHGLLVRCGCLYVVDAGAKSVIEFDPQTGKRTTIAADLPIGPPPGVVPKPLRGLMPFSGPLRPFAGLAAAPDGALYFSADGDGSVLALKGPRDAGGRA